MRRAGRQYRTARQNCGSADSRSGAPRTLDDDRDRGSGGGDLSSIADRIRGIVSTGKPAAARPTPDVRETGASAGPVRGVEAALSGEWRDSSSGPCFVVETRFDAAALYGRARV